MKTKWLALAVLASQAVWGEQTFYITMPSEDGGTEAVEVVHAEDRLDAIGHSAITVWTKEDWDNCKPCHELHPKIDPFYACTPSDPGCDSSKGKELR